MQWDTSNCIFGWDVGGIWPPCSSGSDINSVDKARKGNLIASGDDFSKVKLFKYPCIYNDLNRPASLRFSGHADKVTGVRFT